MQGLLLFISLFSSGFGFGYDGTEDDKHYFQVNTPEADYGFVVDKSNVYCDVVVQK